MIDKESNLLRRLVSEGKITLFSIPLEIHRARAEHLDPIVLTKAIQGHRAVIGAHGISIDLTKPEIIQPHIKWRLVDSQSTAYKIKYDDVDTARRRIGRDDTLHFLILEAVKSKNRGIAFFNPA